MSKLDSAIEAIQRGFFVFPVYGTVNGVCSCDNGKDCNSPGKHPWISDWPNTSSKDEEQIRTWWNQKPNSNIGIVTGERSKIVVIDLDSEESYNEFKKSTTEEERNTYTVKTSRGYHYYYSSDSYPNRKNILPGMDVQGDKAYVIGAGSTHISGAGYNVVNNDHISIIPSYVNTLVKSEGKKEPLTSEDWKAELPKTTRNIELTRRIGKLIGMGIDPAEVYIMAMALNETKCNPPLDSKEVKTIVKSIHERYKNKKLKDKKDTEDREENEPLQFLSSADFFQTFSEEPVEWIIKDWLPDNTVGFCTAPPGTFKTWLLLALAYSVSTGEKYLDTYDIHKKGKVLFIQQEDSYSMLVTRMIRIMKIKGSVWNVALDELQMDRREMPDIIWHTEKELHFKDKKSLKRLENLIKQNDVKLVIIDPLYSLVDMKDYMLDAAQEILGLKKLRDKYGVSFIIAHHTKKGLNSGGRQRDDMWGTQFLNAALETGWNIRLRGEDDEAVQKTAVITVERHFKSHPNPFDVDIMLNITEEGFNPQIITGEPLIDEAVTYDKHLHFLDKPPTLKPEYFSSAERTLYNYLFFNRTASLSDIVKVYGSKINKKQASQIIDKFLELGLIMQRGAEQIYRFREETISYNEKEMNREKFNEIMRMAEILKIGREKISV